MALTKDKKIEIVKKLDDIINNAQSIVFVNFSGLSVNDTGEMRKNLREKDTGYFVAKKTLVKRALSASKIEGDIPTLDGELALAYGSDPIVPASTVAEFAKKHKKKISILGGVFEGRYMDQPEMITIASIPPIEVLYGQFVNIINSPIQGLVVALNEVAKTKN